jgi:polyisoprenoid-binding protein YceI
VPHICGLWLILACGAAGLAAADFTIDAAQSTVGFSGTSTFHDFTGTAKLVSGTVHLDATAPSGVIEADAASMTTADTDRDERLHNFVMDVPTHPRVRFELTGWTPSATGGTATGNWTMVGVAKPVTFPVTIAGGRAKAHLDLNIRDWKIRTPRVIFITVGDIVGVDLDLALTATP